MKNMKMEYKEHEERSYSEIFLRDTEEISFLAVLSVFLKSLTLRYSREILPTRVIMLEIVARRM